MELKQINEGSTGYLTVTFKDKAGDPAAPSGITYRIDDLASGTEVLGDTAVTPGASVEITLPPSVHVPIGNARTQHRRVTVKATYGADDGINAEYEYELINLGGVT